MQKKVLSCDWWEVCVSSPDVDLTKVKLPLNYRVKRLDYSTRNFANVFDVYRNDYKVASVCNCPFSPVIQADTAIVKVTNALLYRNDCYAVICELFSVFAWQYRSTTRIDLCCDFVEIADANITSVPHFISLFLAGQVYKAGRFNFSLNGRCEGGVVAPFSYIRFGNSSSSCSIALYNKSLELQQTKKTYIEELWVSSGLVDRDKLPLTSVWRLEFRITDSRYKMTDTTTGEESTISPFRVLSESAYLSSIYQAIADKVWVWRYPSLSESNRSRWARVCFFDDFDHVCQHVRFVERLVAKSNRTAKIVLRQLSLVYDTMVSCSFDPSADEQIQAFKSTITDYIYHNGLEDYYLERISGRLTSEVIAMRKEETSMQFYQRLRNMYLSDAQLQALREARPISWREHKELLRSFTTSKTH